ncbi:MAG: glycosyltransferase [Rivularia sp. (in: cyanobacteria)]
MAEVSIIIPAYNAHSTIIETIKSVQKQTFSDWELIVIDDGSTDNTLEVLDTVEDSRIKVFSYKNGGVSVARNRGISHAMSDFIAFLDADDLWTRDKLELQLTALKKYPEAGVAYSWTMNMNSTGDTFYSADNVYFQGNVYGELLIKNFIANGSNLLIRQEAIESIGEFDSTVVPCEDWDYYLRLASNWDFVVVPKPQILYRHSPESQSANVDIMEQAYLTIIDRTFKVAPPELQSLKNKSLANAFQYFTGVQLANVTNTKQMRQAAQKLWKAISFYPQILLQRRTQRYLLKLLVMQLISPKISKYLTKPIGLATTVSDPRRQC